MQPTTNTNGILMEHIGIPTPPSGSVTYYFDDGNSNRLTYKDDAGNNHLATDPFEGIGCDPCLCEMASKTMCSWNQALLDGTLTETTYLALITAGVTFTCVTAGVTNTFTIKIPI